MKVGRKPGLQGEAGPAAPAVRNAPGDGPRPSAPRRSRAKRGSRGGQMLTAMPTMGDARFTRSLIYVCAHSSEGAMGIIVNQPAAHISFPDLLVQLEVVGASDLIQLPPRAGG